MISPAERIWKPKLVVFFFENLIKKHFFRYEIVKPEKIDQALELLYATYHPDEPLTKHLGKHRGGIFSHSVYMYLNWGPVVSPEAALRPHSSIHSNHRDREELRPDHPLQIILDLCIPEN